MLRAFFAGAVAALTLGLWNPTGSGKLTMFEAEYKTPPHIIEYPIIIMLGIVGGLIGAAFVHFNSVVSTNRGPGTWFRKKCHIVLEVLLISLFTALTSYHLIWTRVLSNTTIKALFHDCMHATTETPAGSPTWLDMCVIDGNSSTANLSTSLMLALLLSGFLRWFQMIFTFGTGCAAGLFIPSLYVGGALGRIVGMLLLTMNNEVGIVKEIFPGIYAMLGAAAVLGGVCRVTISLVVIMFELTGGLQLIVPFMIVCMLAKWVGDAFTLGIYDYIIAVRKYPFLHEPDELSFHTFAKDVMDEGFETLHPQLGTVDGLLSFLRHAEHGGYPLTLSPTDPTLVGYVHTSELLAHIEKEMKKNVFIGGSMKVEFSRFCDQKDPRAMDVSKFADEAIMQCSPETPAVQLQSIFRNLGVKVILVKHRAALVGIITKKSFITHMGELRNPVRKKKEGLQEGLLQAP
jgi:chloride channel 3/4/5